VDLQGVRGLADPQRDVCTLAEGADSGSRPLALLADQVGRRRASLAGVPATILDTGKCVAVYQRASYSGRAAARNVLCIGKEVLAMFTNRQTPPGVAL
jgi:hypothetical protein